MTVELEQNGIEHEGTQVLELAPHQLLTAFPGLNVCAPMVRYSKLPFRALVARYDTHITTTPMMLAKEFSRSQPARDAELTTNEWERGTFQLIHGVQESSLSAQKALAAATENGTLGEKEREAKAHEEQLNKHSYRVKGSVVAQFASSTPEALADACELVAGTMDGVDLNCGW